MIRPTRISREWLAEWSELIFAFAVPILCVLVLCLAVEPALVAFFTRNPA